MANIFNQIFNKSKKVELRSDLNTQFYNSNPIYGTMNFSTSDSYTQSKALKIAALYRCLEVVSNSIAVMEINNFIIKNNWKQKQYNTLYNLLNIAPNRFMSSFTLKKQMILNLLMNGNAYILIKRDGDDNINELVLLDPSTVQIIAVNNDIKYNVITNNYSNLPEIESKIYDKSEIIHILNFTLNGFVGISTLTYANLILGTAYSSELQANNFFTSNNILTGILKPTSGTHLTKDKADKAKESFLNTLNQTVNTNGSSVIVLGDGLDYQPIQTSPKDSMLIESQKYTALQICQYFGVPSHKAFLDERNIAQNNETQQIEFLNSTLLPLMEKIESEMYRKLVLPIEYATTEIKFDPSNLLRLDATTQANVFTKLHNLGAMTTNEIRSKIDSDFPVTGGNRAFVNQNAQPLDNILNDVKAGQNKPNDNNI